MGWRDRYLMGPILGMLTKRGAKPVMETSVHNLPFILSNFAKRNAMVRRMSYVPRSPSIRFHGSRAMGGY